MRSGGDLFTPLISLAQVEELLAIPHVFEQQMVSLRAKGDSVSLAPSTPGDIYARLRQGASLQFRKMERFLPVRAPLRQLYRDILLRLQHPGVSISCFVTPPGTELLGAHHDETDVFTLQVAGRKRWRLFHTISAEGRGNHSSETLGEPEHDFVLEPGDLLYHPRGCIHEVVCEDELSFSIPIVIEPITWKTLLHQLVERLGDRREFLEALPAGTILQPDATRRLAGGVATRAASLAGLALKSLSLAEGLMAAERGERVRRRCFIHVWQFRTGRTRIRIERQRQLLCRGLAEIQHRIFIPDLVVGLGVGIVALRAGRDEADAERFVQPRLEILQRDHAGPHHPRLQMPLGEDCVCRQPHQPERTAER